MSNTDTAPLATQPAQKLPIIKTVLAKFETLKARGLDIPAGYSAENAMAQAQLLLPTIVNNDKKLIVDANGRPTGTVTEVSIVNALLAMLVEGMSLQKKQVYLIVYGNTLTCQRGVYGDMALAQRVSKVPLEFYKGVIRKGDTVKIVTRRGKDFVEHEKVFGAGGEVIGAYFGAINTDTGEDLGATIFDMARIKKSWGMSKTYRADGNGTHNKFDDEMALRTVARHYCKPIINASDDEMMLQLIRAQDMIQAEEEAKAAIEAGANKELLELPKRARAKVVEREFAEEPETQAPAVPVTPPAEMADASTEEADDMFADDEAEGAGGPGY